MKRILKGFMACLILFVALSGVSSEIFAQSYYDLGYPVFPPWIFPTDSSGPNLLTDRLSALQPQDILVDDFEYQDSPFNNGWERTEPIEPVYGFGMGYSTIFNTVLDLQQGSRVLDVYRPASIFLIGTPYEKHGMSFDLSLLPDADAGGISMETHPTIGFEFRAPRGIEPWDLFELEVVGEGKGETVTLSLSPETPESTSVINLAQEGEVLQIEFFLEREILDGEWHTIQINLTDVIHDALVEEGLDPDAWGLEKATSIAIRGQMFRMDNIMFLVSRDDDSFYPPHLFKIGPRSAEIFETYRYLFVADYAIGDGPVSSIYDFMISGDYPDIFITDPDEIANIWVTEYGADPDRFGSSADPKVSAIMGRDFVIDPQLPIFANPNYRLGKNSHLETISGLLSKKTLTWHIAPSRSGTQRFKVTPLEIDPYDGMPTYLPVYYAMKTVFEKYNKSFFGPEECLRLECALWNVGFTLWPNVAKFDFTPQAFEDLTLTIEVCNGPYSDKETFPVSVVNYPVQNHAPVIWGLENLLFFVGESYEHLFTAIDPDCMIFSVSDNPEASHKPAIFEDFRTDMENIYWEFLNFDLFMWTDRLDHNTGLFTYIPRFEEAYSIVLDARDPYGGYSIAEFGLFCNNRGTWLNHAPFILGGPEEPLVVNAGEEAILSRTDFAVEDPDGDQVYASCNVGTCRRGADGAFMWTFQTNFPGLYDIEIFFYDIRGGYARMEFQVDVKSWWAYE